MIGDISQGIDMERVRPFMVASNRLQSDEECNRCPIGSGCSLSSDQHRRKYDLIDPHFHKPLDPQKKSCNNICQIVDFLKYSLLTALVVLQK